MRTLRRLSILLLLLLLVLLTGCGGTTRTVTVTSRAPAVAAPAPACPAAAKGNGSMGACTPPSLLPQLSAPPSFWGASTYPDLSNNNALGAGAIAGVARAGHRLLSAKTNQGTTFIDRTFRSMVIAARANGLATQGYDFVSCYCAAEARTFVSILRNAGMTRDATRWGPPVLDIEYGSASRGGVQVMVNILRAEFGRVAIYTGAWYWTPHLGQWWPAGVQGWLAGYPSAPRCCGLPAYLFVAHQYTDHGFNGASNSDMNLYLSPAGGASFDSYIRAAAPKPPHVSKHAHLAKLYARRKALRGVLAAHGCRTKRHGARRCKVWFAHGDAVNAAIKVLHRQHIY